MKRIYLRRADKNKIKKIYLSPIDQLWHNLVNMNNEDYEKLKQYISDMDTKNCSFLHYHCRDFMNKLIQLSDCYHKNKS